MIRLRARIVLDAVRSILGEYWALLGEYWALLGEYWALLGEYWALLGEYWAPLGEGFRVLGLVVTTICYLYSAIPLFRYSVIPRFTASPICGCFVLSTARVKALGWLKKKERKIGSAM